MALQICPNCKSESFIWSNQEDNLLTQWRCNKCDYTAYEDESLQRDCADCKTNTEVRLEEENSNRKYWWCSNCNKTTETQS